MRKAILFLLILSHFVVFSQDTTKKAVYTGAISAACNFGILYFSNHSYYSKTKADLFNGIKFNGNVVGLRVGIHLFSGNTNGDILVPVSLQFRKDISKPGKKFITMLGLGRGYSFSIINKIKHEVFWLILF